MNRYPGDGELERIIRWHIKHYPRLEIRDLVKLAYQDVFGNRHFQSGIEDALKGIENEMKNHPREGTPGILIEPVSPDPAGGWVRVSLTGWQRRGGRFDALAGVCTASAATSPKEPGEFLARLQWVDAFLFRARIRLPGGSLDDWRNIMEKNGYPPVSHSRTYSSVYRPAYRVVRFPLLAGFLPLHRNSDQSSAEKRNVSYQ